jgi:hypothetical protein
MYCDNLPLIQQIGWHAKQTVTTPRDVYRSDYDLEIAIKDTIDTLREKKIHIKEKHVRGHQDDHADFHSVRHEEQLNVEADKEATKALQEHSKAEEYNQMPTIISMLYHNGLPVTSKETETLSNSMDKSDTANMSPTKNTGNQQRTQPYGGKLIGNH